MDPLSPQERALGDPITTGVTQTNQPAATTSSSSVSTGTPSSTALPYPIYALPADKGQLLNWAAIAVVLGFVLIIVAWRLTHMRHRSLKGFFLPYGLHIHMFGRDIIKITPPPAPPTGTVFMSDLEAQRQQARRARRAEERFQRRRTRGDNIGEGGQREDGFDSADDDDRAERETLPGYKADIRAPVYLEEWAPDTAHPAIDHDDEDVAHALRESAAAAGSTLPISSTPNTPGAEERMLSVEEYEARQRGEVLPSVDISHQPAPAAPRTAPTPETATRPQTPPLAHILHRHSLRRPAPSRTTSVDTMSPPPDYRPSSRPATPHRHPLAVSSTGSTLDERNA